MLFHIEDKEILFKYFYAREKIKSNTSLISGKNDTMFFRIIFIF